MPKLRKRPATKALTAEVGMKKGTSLLRGVPFVFGKRVFATVLHEGIDNEIVNQFGHPLFNRSIEQDIILIVGKD